MVIDNVEMSSETRDTSMVAPTPPSARWHGVVMDLVIVAALATVAVLVRRHGLPTHGLWLDDSVEGAAVKAPLSQLIIVSQDHPGYMAFLMGWSRVFGGSDVSLAFPALLAGVIGPVFMYFTLRRLGYERSIGVLLSAALVASQADIVYSGRLKSDTADVIVVLFLVLLVHRLARIRWHWWTGVLWIAGAFVLGSISVFALIAVAVAGLVLLIHPSKDLHIRGPAIGLQIASNATLGVVIVNSYNTQAVQAQWRDLWDAFVKFYPNPLRFGSEVLHHLSRVAQVMPGGPSWFTTTCALVAIAGLVMAAWRGRQAIAARYLLLLLGVAFAGGLMGKVPFGPSETNPVATGERASLWLVPVFAVGLAAVLQRVRELFPRRALPMAFDTFAIAGAAVTLAFALEATPLSYPLPAPAQAVSFVDSHVGPKDSVLLAFPSYSFAAESDFRPSFLAQPTGFPGYTVTFADARIHTLGFYPDISAQQVGEDVHGANRVFVYISQPALNSAETQAEAVIDYTMAGLRYHLNKVSFQYAQVDVWTNSAVVPPARKPPQPAARTAEPPLVKVAYNSVFGPILVDDQGETLYTLTNNGKSVLCDVKACEQSVWHPLLLPPSRRTVAGAAGPGVYGLGRAGRSVPYVITWKDQILFYYSGDTAPGQTKGNGIADFGGVWHVVSAAGPGQ